MYKNKQEEIVGEEKDVLEVWATYFKELQGPFTGKPEFFFYRAFIANTEIIKLSLFNIVPC